MSRSKYRPNWRRKPPRWYTNLMVRQSERRWVNEALKNLVKTPKEELEDTPEFPKGNKPNADFDWM